MTIQILLTTPTPNERQVSTSTPLVLDISGLTDDGYGPDLSTLSVQVNGTYAIKAGVFQLPSAFFGEGTGAAGSAPEESTRFYDVPNNPFKVGDRVEVTDSINSIQTTIIGIVGTVIELRNALELQPVDLRLPTYQIDITALSRGYTGSLGLTTTINPLAPLLSNAVVFVTAEVYSIPSTHSIPDTAEIPLDAERTRRVFTFRTVDSRPPQLVDFPGVIYNSNLSFKIADILDNQVDINSVSITLDGVSAIEDGAIQSSFMGALIPRTDSLVEVYLRPKLKYVHNKSLQASIQVSDGYGNAATYTKNLLNQGTIPQVEFIEILPASEEILDPTNTKLTINLRVTEPLNTDYINLSYEVDGVLNPDTGEPRLPIIEVGQFVNREGFVATYGEQTGEIRAGGRDVSIIVDSLKAVTFNKKVKVFLTLQEVTDLGDVPVGLAPFYEKTFNFTTISAPLNPLVDNFFPTDSAPISASTQIRCRVRSQVQGAPIDFNSIRVVVNNTSTAIDQGSFSNGWTGTIIARQGSSGHAANIILNQPLDSQFEIGATVDVSVTVADIAGNTTTAPFTFQVANTNAPVVTITPPGGVFKELTRIRIDADQASTIYYTIDGSKPEIGNISTFAQVNPITNVPIFRDGVTQIKAFAVSATGIAGPTTTAVFDLNPFVPEVAITSPLQNQLLDKPSVGIDYIITLQRGFLVSVEISVNNGPLLNIENTLLQSTVSVTGLRTGTNTIELVATDNAGNIGKAKLSVNVKASQIIDFGIKFAPLHCPEFTPRIVSLNQTVNDIVDTTTVAIIGLGSRKETLVSFGVGQGEDGSPVDFVISNRPDGRHFTVRSFPIRSHKLYLYRKGRTFQVPARDYVINTSTGQLVLDHPIETGEGLSIEYIAEPDINAPTLFTSDQLEAVYAKHGRPSLENTLSLAVQMAFENGAVRVLAVQGEDPTIDASWFESYKALEGEEAYWIVPVARNSDISLYPTILQAAFNHVELMSNILNRKERIVAGWRLPNAANDFGQPRIFLASLDQNPRVTRVVNGELSDLNGSFVAATIAGRGSSLAPVSLPLTSRTVTGFTMHTDKRSPKLDLQREIDQGFFPVQALASGASLYRGRTAYVGITDPVREELSVQRIIDSISKELRKLADNRFRGQVLTPASLRSIGSEIQTYLDSKTSIISQGKLTNLQVDALEPRQLNIEVTLVPLYPLNQFSITFTVAAGI